jgi:hypothetical protein
MLTVTDNQEVFSLFLNAGQYHDSVARLFIKIKSSLIIFINRPVGSVEMRFILIPIYTNGTLRDVVIGHLLILLINH